MLAAAVQVDRRCIFRGNAVVMNESEGKHLLVRVLSPSETGVHSQAVSIPNNELTAQYVTDSLFTCTLSL